MVSRCLVSSANRFPYVQFPMSKGAAIPIFQVSERSEAHRHQRSEAHKHQPGTATLVPWSHDTPVPRFIVPLVSGFQVPESPRSQGPKFLRVAGSPCVVILHGTKAHTFLAFLVSSPLRSAGILLIDVYRQSRRLVQHAPSIHLASSFRGCTPAMMAQATWSLRQLGFKISSLLIQLGGQIAMVHGQLGGKVSSGSSSLGFQGNLVSSSTWHQRIEPPGTQ